jgi:ribonuclease HI
VKLSQLNASEGIGLFTDGSSWHIDRSGGWAYIAIDAFGSEYTSSGAYSDTTNNQMEMMAWIKGLQALADALGPCQVIVFSDSEYVGLGAINRDRNRRNNSKFWKQLDAAVDRHLYVEFAHVKGHSGHHWNSRVDKLAGEARRKGNQ